jgi:hypothetical protein
LLKERADDRTAQLKPLQAMLRRHAGQFAALIRKQSIEDRCYPVSLAYRSWKLHKNRASDSRHRSAGFQGVLRDT